MVTIHRVRNAFNAVTAKKSGRLKNIRKKLRIPRPLKPFNCSYPFKGPAQYKKLYVLVSLDATRGNILHLSTNYTQHQTGDSLRYSYKGNTEPTMHHRDIVQKVDMREAQFLRRSQFDEIQYGSAVLKRNGKGAILRPVITRHTGISEY